jgi:hypothetical protein
VLDANAQKLEAALSSDPAWRTWFMQWAQKSKSSAQGCSVPDPSLGFTQSYVSASDFASAGPSNENKRTRASCGHCGKGNAKNRCGKCGQVHLPYAHTLTYTDADLAFAAPSLACARRHTPLHLSETRCCFSVCAHFGGLGFRALGFLAHCCSSC